MLGIACGDGAESTPDEKPTPADIGAIRDVNFGQQSDVGAAINRIGGGSVASKEIVYADITGDLREEAIVPIASGGTLGNISYLIFTMQSGSPSLLLTRNMDRNSPSGLTMAVEKGVLTEYIGEFGPSDPFCCPSILRKTTFRWDGSKLQVQGEERVPAAGGKQ